MNFEIILWLGITIYCYYIYLAWKGYSRKDDILRYPKRFVSVVIAARNEEKNLPELLLRLKNQSYPEDSYEVILMDDGSEDNTSNIAEKFEKNWPNLRVISVKYRESAISKKKNALQQGIELANGDHILLTDADCLPGTHWISSTISCFKDDTDMVVGLSRTSHPAITKVLSSQWFEHIDFMNMFSIAGGLIRSGKYFSCSGQNLAYKKSSWKKVDGFNKISHIISGDDVNLMQLFRKSDMKIDFNINAGSFMTTGGISSWQALINQRTRWASNTWFQLRLNPEFFLYLMCVLVVTFMPWILLGSALKTGLAVILIRMLVELVFLRKVFGILKEPRKMLYSYPVWFVIQPIYILIVSLLGFFGFFSWKK